MWTTAGLATLQAAIASGARTVRFADRTIEYASIEDMLTALNTITQFLAAQNTTVRQVRSFGQSGWLLIFGMIAISAMTALQQLT
jgi:hypothetical protein